MTISPLMTTTSRKICNTRTPSPCSTVWKNWPTDRGLEFGLKLSNTFPVDVKAGELPSEEMYMAGKSLFPLTTTMAARLSREFDGKLRLSYAGGADAFNIDKLFACGIWPITMATTELKPGGYQRFTQIGEILDKLDFAPFGGVDVLGIDALALSARRDKYHLKDIKPLPRRKLLEKVPLMDCFTAPCEGGCPIRQDIPEYIELCRKGKYAEALALITEKNALPFTTGTICAHRCQTKCTRNYYDDPVQIRATKLIAAEKGYDDLMASLKKPEPVTDGREGRHHRRRSHRHRRGLLSGPGRYPCHCFRAEPQAGRRAPAGDPRLPHH